VKYRIYAKDSLSLLMVGSVFERYMRKKEEKKREREREREREAKLSMWVSQPGRQAVGPSSYRWK
jgi:hypothetical protein